MRSKRENGFLLMEALVAMALLVTGVSVASNTFSTTRMVLMRGSQLDRLATCVQEKILTEITSAPLTSSVCTDEFSWAHHQEFLAGGVQKISWTAHWKENDRDREETFEVVR